MSNQVWAYGVTTVPERRASGHLLKTLRSLEATGFKKPSLFIDGESSGCMLPYPITYRGEKINVLGNWYLGLVELYIRNPTATLFAMFQDDILCVRGLKEYVEKCPPTKYIEGGTYYNLFTQGQNEHALRGKPNGWYEGCLLKSNSTSKLQRGLGALGLVFPRQAVIDLLSSRDWVQKPLAASDIGWKNIDGGVVNALNKLGWREMVHWPGLLQHTGLKSTIVRNPDNVLSASFPGEDFNALEFLKQTC